MYGVSYANLNMLKKRIKFDQTLARGLWATGVHDAKVLAMMIAEPRQMDEALLEQWAAELRDHTITGALADLAGATTFAQACAERWIARDDERIERIGWQLMAHLAMHDSSLTTEYFEPYVARIEQTIHEQKNWVKEAMNGALIAIGSRDQHLEARALAAAAVIGIVNVDQGDTYCKTPDAAAYIKKMRARREQKLAKKALLSSH